MSRVVRFDSFGGPDRLRIEQVDPPRPRRGELRVRVSAIGLNPMDWRILADPRLAAAFGITAPAGFGHDFAGVVDATTDNDWFAVGDRVFGSVTSRAATDYLIVDPRDVVHDTPEDVSDVVASTLGVAGLTASAALDAVQVGAGDTLLIGGAAGGVGVLTAQLARLTGARVLGTAAPTTARFLNGLGVEPVAYGSDLAAGLRASGVAVTAALDLFASDTVHAALELGVSAARIAAIAAGADLPAGVRRTGAADADPAALQAVAAAVAAGMVTVPIAATMPLEQIRDAVRLQAGGHVHGKIVVTT